MLVFIVIFVPETVTAFLDKEVAIDLDKVQIEAPADDAAPPSDPAADMLKPGETASEDASKKSADDEQKKMDELFKK